MRAGFHLIVILVLAMVYPATPGGAATTQEAARDAQRRLDDVQLIARVKSALITDQVTRGHRITIATFEGVVQLSGFVSSAAEKARAGEVAAAVPGVVEVRNAIQVRQALADGAKVQYETRRVARAVTNEQVGDDLQVERQ